ncbi:hypothetical protein [Rhizobium sp. S163]|uniref:hypothetical protein n=1 Tax=Rhizobium sp. S163 TaxID=3055039 RepID=UPI000DB934FD|nr:hypothetical protein [Rhizobium sp. S163]MDM9644879.1 hypothetical protein [Rhizobium sp. S163]
MKHKEFQESVIRNYLGRLLDAGSGQRFNAENALMTHGVLMDIVGERPASIVLGERRHCYSNSVRALVCQGPDSADELFYCEGYAMEKGGVWLPIQHAWLVDGAGRVIDPTWHDASEHVYFGVSFRTSFVLEMLELAGMEPGLLNSPVLMRRHFGTPQLFAAALGESLAS